MADTGRTIVKHLTRHGREFIQYSDGSEWTRKLNRKTGEPSGDWTAVEAPPVESAASSTRYLSLVAQAQTDGEPKHWSLFSHHPDTAGTGRGQVWQVKGDAEYMHYKHAENIDILNSASFAWHQVLNSNLSDAQFAKVNRIARTEPPPHAASRGVVTENCQGWTMRVLWRLVQEGVVEQTSVTMLQQYMDPIS
jgi:hypothetical protein